MPLCSYFDMLSASVIQLSLYKCQQLSYNCPNTSKSFFKKNVIETGLSDFHQMPSTILKSNNIKCKPKQIVYRNYKNYEMGHFRQHLIHALKLEETCTTYFDVCDIYINILKVHAPLTLCIHTPNLLTNYPTKFA